MKRLSQASQSVFDELLGGYSSDQKGALGTLGTLPEQEQSELVAALIERLPGADGPTRSWIVSALATLATPAAVKVVVQRIDPKVDEYEWTRYWAVIGAVQMGVPDLQKHLEKATKDPDELVMALAMSFLVEMGFGDKYLDTLLEMGYDRGWHNKWAVGKAIRQVMSQRAFREGVEARFIPMLESHLGPDEWRDVQYQAATALGNVTHRWPAAIEILTRGLQRSLPDVARRACVDALAHIGRPETRDALLYALTDPDAEIRVRAADALKSTLQAVGAVRFLVDQVLGQGDPPIEYFDALRRIDPKEAADALTNYLVHPDPETAERASRALTALGGEQAIRSLQAQRQAAVKIYSDMLESADNRIMAQFASLIAQAQKGFTVSMWMHGAIFVLGLALMVFGLYVALSGGFETFERFVGVGTAAGSLATIVLMFYTGPIRNIRQSVTDLVQVNVVFLGYIRQLNQIDATFKQLFLSRSEFGTEHMTATVEQIQRSVRNTMDEVRSYLDRPAGTRGKDAAGGNAG